MPFFRKRKYPESKTHKRKANPKLQLQLQDDEITSSEDDNEANCEPSEDESETVQDKKLRLAKQYLGRIEHEECKRGQEKNTSAVSERFKLDNLKAAGKLKINVADQYQADVDTSKLLKCKEHRHSVTCVCLSSDDQFVFSGSKDGSIVKCRQISHAGASVAIGDASGGIQICNPTDLKLVGTLHGHRDAVTGLKFRHGSDTLYSCSKDRSVKVWSINELSHMETLYGHRDGITAIDVLSQERAVTAGGRDAKLWKIVEESHLVYNGISSANIDAIRLISDGYFVSGGDDGCVCVWSTSKKKPLCCLKEAHGHDAGNAEPFGITAVAALPNTDLLATGSSDGLVRVWKAGDKFRTLTPVFTVTLVGFVNDLVFSSDGRYLVAGVGKEYRLGRWMVIKAATNGVVVIPLKVLS